MAGKYPNNPRVLVIDDDPGIRKTLTDMLNLQGFDTVSAGNGAEALESLEERPADVALIDLTLPDIPGTRILTRIKNCHAATQAIILTADSALETAVDCMKEGACDYLVKPVENHILIGSIRRALELLHINCEVSTLLKTPMPEKLANEDKFAHIKTCDEKMREIFRYIEVIAQSQQPVLITGETGVGKELFAQAIYNISNRPGPFVAVNVASLDDLMFSDTLFGHKKGSYTNAVDIREGLVRNAAEGTLFLDEIGDLSDSSQIKLLRLLQEGEYYQLGSDVPIKCNARLLFATNRNLKSRVHEGVFRKDLYYRLNTHKIAIPPLRERKCDISLLLDHFIKQSALCMGKTPLTYTKELVILLSTYDYPGNVREFQSIIFDAVARSSSSKLSMDVVRQILNDAREELSGSNEFKGSRKLDFSSSKCFSRFPTLKEAEQELVSRALDMAQGNQGIAASLLGISRQALNKRLRHGN
jgi:DNA-binding NtrC family response regulator